MSDRYERPRVTFLGVVCSPLTPNLSAEVFTFGCTALERPGAACAASSPHTRDVRELRQLAIAAGWRLSGSDEPELLNGEALCPMHRSCSIADVIAKYAQRERLD